MVGTVTFKVKRIMPGCCNLEQGMIYEARWEFRDYYIDIKLHNGQWVRSHFFPGFFEIVT